MTAPTPLMVQARAMSEHELMEHIRAKVVELGIAAFHAGDSRGSWGPGFPDLVLVGANGILFVECKRESEQLRPLQQWWRKRILLAKGRYMVWRPSDWLQDTITDVLREIA